MAGYGIVLVTSESDLKRRRALDHKLQSCERVYDDLGGPFTGREISF